MPLYYDINYLNLNIDLFHFFSHESKIMSHESYDSYYSIMSNITPKTICYMYPLCTLKKKIMHIYYVYIIYMCVCVML